MLKDITLGQFFPGETAIHNMDPRVKLLLTFVFIVVLFIVKGFLAMGIVFLWLALAIGVSRIRPRVILRGLKPLIFVISITGIFNLFYVGGQEIFSIGPLTVTVEGVQTAVFMVLRILMLVSGTFLLTYTTSPILLTDGIESVLGPLKVIKVPVHEIAMMMTIALRFIPTLIEETDKIMSAQKARGADFESGNLIKRAKALIPLLVPLFISAFRRAFELSDAMECRCYRGGEGRTRLRVLKLSAVDGYATGITALFFAAAITLSFINLV
ncbi:energy-coupling factor transporter transmembrane protein EcfT [Oscillospiraceae bacterium OttesenSCG-928-G22]|nr:energy-coupling factor transporter transmembrane protein EcfT [Oscillospiraceae bacterium OttesenSCG-928-G22]